MPLRGGVDHGELSIRYKPSRRVEQRLVSPQFEVELRGAVTESTCPSDFAALLNDFARAYIKYSADDGPIWTFRELT